MKNLFGSVKRDLPASIVVFLVAVPLCLGIALASGAPPFSGLLAGLIGGLVVGSISGSSLGVSGPAAGLAAIVITGIATLGSFQLFLLAVLLAGLIQVVLGLLKGGVIAYYFPSSVIKGMLAGIGVFIALTQVPHALGFDMEQFTDSLAPSMQGGVFSDLTDMLNAVTPGALAIAAVCMSLLLIWERPFVKDNPVLSRIPGPLLAVVTGIAMGHLGGVFPLFAMEGTHFVQLPDLGGETATALFAGPDWSGINSLAVWIVALTMAVVASLETLLSVEAIDKLDPHRRVTPTNRELIAQGIGNTVAGLIGALPLTQVIVRSSANVQAGGNSKASAILHGVWILVAVTLFPSVLRQIPLAALAAILLQVGLKLAKPALFRSMWQGGWKMFTPFIVTVLGVLYFDLLKGVSLGMAVALFIILRNNYKVPFHMVERAVPPGTPIRIALGEEVSFLNKANIQRVLSELPPESHIIIDLSRTVALDPDILEILEDEQERAKDKRSIVEITGLKEHRRTRAAAPLGLKHVREAYHFVTRTENDPASV